MKFPRSPTELLKALIAIPSVTPEAEGAETDAGEAALAGYVADLLRQLGGDVELQAVQPGRPNVVARFASSQRGAPTIALVPHLDTVGVAGMTSPFTPMVRRGRLHGRGACDTKGPMAAALWALCGWTRNRRARSMNVCFAATMGEEELSVGAKALCDRGFKADFAIALEPTGLQVVRAAKGVLRVWVEQRGRAAHGSTPEKGSNAVYELAPFLLACRDRLAPAFARARHPLLGPASLNLGLVRGGTELNVVPDRCVVGLDMRTHPRFGNAEALAAVREAAGAATVTLHRQGNSFVLDPRHPWARRLARVGRGFTAVPWFSDANVFNEHGIPAVAFGPGSIAQAHTANEYISIVALEAGAAAIGHFLEKA